MLCDISYCLEKLEVLIFRSRIGRDLDLFICYACGGVGYLKRSCNWIGYVRFFKVLSKVIDMFLDRIYRRGMSFVRYKENSS